jgi:hypothetical protein
MQSPAEINDLNLPLNRLNPVLKGAAVNHLRLDSIVEITNKGYYFERNKWQFDYDSNNQLKTSSRFFLDVDNEFTGEKEFREYDENGKTLRLVFSKLHPWEIDSIMTTKTVENQYLDGNLDRQTTILFDLMGRANSPEIKTFNYNENNQLIKIVTQYYRWGGEQLLSTYFIYDEDDRRKYKLEESDMWAGQFLATKNEYVITDTTLIIQEKFIKYIAYMQPSNLDRIRTWMNGDTYRLSLDQSGRTTSIEKSLSPSWPKLNYRIYRVEYEYSSTGKLNQSTFYLPDDQINFNAWVKATIIKNTYDSADNLLKYEKIFFDARVNDWVAEETKTYYYNSTKNSEINDVPNKTGGFYIYPNPATDDINFTMAPESNSKYIIYSSLGEAVDQGDFNSQSISISKLTTGIYFIKVEQNGDVFINRFFKR